MVKKRVGERDEGAEATFQAVDRWIIGEIRLNLLDTDPVGDAARAL
jgi:hypothetical protein